MKVESVGVKGVELTMVSESFEARPYKCPAGVWTQGYGTTRNPDTGKLISEDDAPITKDTAKRWLMEDYKRKFFPVVDDLVTDTVTQGEMDALLDFTYNTGGYYMDKKTSRRFPYRLFYLVNEYKKGNLSADDLKKYWLTCAITAGGKKLPGLVTRRRREVELFFTNNFK